MKIYLIRHAESVYNAKKLFQGRRDCELSPKGIRDTVKKASVFPSDFDVVFCSPLKRARQTREILLPDAKVIYDERIAERSFGDWETTLVTEDKLSLLDKRVTPPNGESVDELESRIIDFINMLKKDYRDKKILVVTHGGVINAIHRLLKMPFKFVGNLEIAEVDI